MVSVRQENRWRRTIQQQNDVASDRLREIEAAAMVRTIRPARHEPSAASATRRAVRAWMRANSGEYESATALAEAANVEFDLPGDGLDDETHWAWEEAARCLLEGGD